MADFRYLPISYVEDNLLAELMREEEKAWMADLCWDYAPIRQVLGSFINQKLLPGYAALDQNEAVGYTYFLVNQTKGIIGALYVSKSDRSQAAVEELLSLSISCLKESPNIKRVEAQIMPFNDLQLTATFTRHGFTYYPRHYLDLDLASPRKEIGTPVMEKIIPWSTAYLERMAEMSALTYRDQIDAELCEDYRTQEGCTSYLRSLVENPGCGIFMPDASFIGLDFQGAPCGFVICTRISERAAMIPQIAVHPDYQGRNLGNSLVSLSFERLKSLGYGSVSLTVTKKNRRAFEWYQRLGFRIKKEFGAYIWERER